MAVRGDPGIAEGDRAGQSGEDSRVVRQARLTSAFLAQYIRERGGVMTVTKDWVVE